MTVFFFHVRRTFIGDRHYFVIFFILDKMYPTTTHTTNSASTTLSSFWWRTWIEHCHLMILSREKRYDLGKETQNLDITSSCIYSSRILPKRSSSSDIYITHLFIVSFDLMSSYIIILRLNFVANNSALKWTCNWKMKTYLKVYILV